MSLNANPTKPTNPMLAGMMQRVATPTTAACTAATGEATEIDTEAAAHAAKSVRPKLWSLDKKFHCPLIGTCVSKAEQAKLAKRFGFSADPRNEFGIHVEAVGCCASRNPVSEALQKHLDRHYAAALREFSALRSADEVFARWQDCLRRGDVAGPFWATVSHKYSSPDVRQAAYGAVHMLSHQVGAWMSADLRRLEQLEHDNVRLQHELCAERASLAQRAELSEDAHRVLRREVASLRDENFALKRGQARLDALENGVTMIELGRRLLTLSSENRALQSAAARSDTLAERATVLTRELAAAQAVCRQMIDERDTLERQLSESTLTASEVPANAPANISTKAVDETTCASLGDCLRCAEKQPLSRARCILCVGGRTSLLSHYRALAERLGIRLIHHDGGQEDAVSRLPELINSADAVLCPTDCVGHNAYFSLKQHCRKTAKPCLLFKGAGVTSFAFALSRLTTGESTLNPVAPKQGEPQFAATRASNLQKNPAKAT